MTIDQPANRIYWANNVGSTISYARLDGSGGGADLNTTGATISSPVGPSVDPAGGKVYWTNFGSNTVSFAKIDGTGGGDLNTAGATVSEPSGAAVDPAHKRVYWTNYGSDGVSYANLDNTGSGGDVNVTGASPNGPFGSPALYFGPPTAAFSAAQSASSLSVAFTDSSTAVSPATVTGWSWDFGDGGTSTVQNPNHTYTTVGTYTVKLTVTDSNGQTDQVSHQVSVKALPPTVSIITPVNGAHYRQRQSVHANYACQDPAGAPGIRSCSAHPQQGARQHQHRRPARVHGHRDQSRRAEHQQDRPLHRHRRPDQAGPRSPSPESYHLPRPAGACKSELNVASTAAARPPRCERGQLIFTGSIDPRANGQNLNIVLTARITGHVHAIHGHAQISHGHYELTVTLRGRQTDFLPTGHNTGGDRWSYTIAYPGNRSLEPARITGHLSLEIEPR